MRTKKVTRHYCDFCSKGSFKRPPMAKHESICTLNPNRVCGVCATFCNDQAPISELLDSIKCGLEKLEEVSGKCPACMLAAIRQSSADSRIFLDDGICAFDFRVAMEKHWKFLNEENKHHGVY